MGARDAVADRRALAAARTAVPRCREGPLARPVLLDVNPSTLSIQTAGGYTERLLDKNSPIPIERTRVFTTARDNQTRVEIDCCRGESRRYAENEPLGHARARGPAARSRAATSRSRCAFRVDADGILHVRASDRRLRQPPGSVPPGDRRADRRRAHERPRRRAAVGAARDRAQDRAPPHESSRSRRLRRRGRAGRVPQDREASRTPISIATA